MHALIKQNHTRLAVQACGAYVPAGRLDTDHQGYTYMQWISSAPSCFNTTQVTYSYYPEGSDDSFLQLSDPSVTEAIFTDIHNNIIMLHLCSGGH